MKKVTRKSRTLQDQERIEKEKEIERGSRFLNLLKQSKLHVCLKHTIRVI